MEIDKQNILLGQNAGLVKKDEIRRKPSDKTAKNAGLKSLFSAMLNETKEPEHSEEVSETASWTDNYMEDNVKKELDKIGNLGRQIKLSYRYDDVLEYKKLVQSYLQNAISRSEKLRERKSGSRFRGNETIRQRIVIINEELNELTREFMKTQISTVKIVAGIDKIQGLLVNLET